LITNRASIQGKRQQRFKRLEKGLKEIKMYMETSTKKIYHCNVELTLDIIGGKWKPLIIHHIGNCEVIRYGEKT